MFFSHFSSSILVFFNLKFSNFETKFVNSNYGQKEIEDAVARDLSMLDFHFGGQWFELLWRWHLAPVNHFYSTTHLN